MHQKWLYDKLYVIYERLALRQAMQPTLAATM